MNTEMQQCRAFAVEYLRYFGNSAPTSNQIEEMQSLLFDVWLIKNIKLDKRLTYRERSCLYLAAQGKSIYETSQLLSISIDTVKAFRKKIIQKLSCKNMPHAVLLGIRYGHIVFPENP